MTNYHERQLCREAKQRLRKDLAMIRLVDGANRFLRHLRRIRRAAWAASGGFEELKSLVASMARNRDEFPETR